MVNWLLIYMLLISTPIIYQYNITVKIVNNEEIMLPNSPPYEFLLNQNIFPNSTYQQSYLNEVTINGIPAHFETHMDVDGNPYIKILTDLPLKKGEFITVSMIFTIQMKGRNFDFSNIGKISEIPREISERYPLIGAWEIEESKREEIINLLNSIVGDEDNALLIILKILKWFEDNMKYSFGLFAPQDLWYTYSTRSGDCDDLANLFVLFCRCLHIPAYTVIGAIYMPGVSSSEQYENMIFNLNNVAWHGWAMVYLPTRYGECWYPVDLTFFRGAYFEDLHIKSLNPIDHIIYSGFAIYPTFEYLSIKTQNYIVEASNVREIIKNSNISWIEYHHMKPLYNTSNIYISIHDFIVIALFIILALLILHKIRSELPRGAPSSI
ncbi:MAG: transglutaminase-like domain-containing protein [Candidatus Methanomethyliaceae archaeon]|nr:transglutaminase-like domain-containing protein [Candidatus Methanomethyliaceae archaeon]MDW7970963.1 transglutaminase-like domain-containing protein [Nitrososphaerota archaeon]